MISPYSPGVHTLGFGPTLKGVNTLFVFVLDYQVYIFLGISMLGSWRSISFSLEPLCMLMAYFLSRKIL